MPSQPWMQFAAQAAKSDGTALTASTTAASITPATGRVLLPPNYFWPGKKIKVVAHGRVSNIVTTPGTLTLDLRIGPASPPTIICANGGAISLNVVAKTNVPWWLEWYLTCRADGSGTSANLIHQGMWVSESVIGSPVPTAGGAGAAMLPNAAPAVGTGFDSTVSNFFDLFAAWSLNNANSILAHQWHVEDMN